MKEKIMNQKGFIQIPLLIVIITSVLMVSVSTGVVLYRQGKLTPLIANVSQVFQETKELELEIKSQESKTDQEQSLLEETNQEENSQSTQELEQVKLEIEKVKQEAERAKAEMERLKAEQEAEKAKAEDYNKQSIPTIESQKDTSITNSSTTEDAEKEEGNNEEESIVTEEKKLFNPRILFYLGNSKFIEEVGGISYAEVPYIGGPYKVTVYVKDVEFGKTYCDIESSNADPIKGAIPRSSTLTEINVPPSGFLATNVICTNKDTGEYGIGRLRINIIKKQEEPVKSRLIISKNLDVRKEGETYLAKFDIRTEDEDIVINSFKIRAENNTSPFLPGRELSVCIKEGNSLISNGLSIHNKDTYSFILNWRIPKNTKKTLILEGGIVATKWGFLDDIADDGENITINLKSCEGQTFSSGFSFIEDINIFESITINPDKTVN